MRPHEIKALLYCKGHHHLKIAAGYRKGKIFTNYTCDRILIYKIWKEAIYIQFQISTEKFSQLKWSTEQNRFHKKFNTHTYF